MEVGQQPRPVFPLRSDAGELGIPPLGDGVDLLGSGVGDGGGLPIELRYFPHRPVGSTEGLYPPLIVRAIVPAIRVVQFAVKTFDDVLESRPQRVVQYLVERRTSVAPGRQVGAGLDRLRAVMDRGDGRRVAPRALRRSALSVLVHLVGEVLYLCHGRLLPMFWLR